MRARLGVAATTALLVLSPLSISSATAATTEPAPAPRPVITQPRPVHAGLGDLFCSLVPWACQD